MAIEIKVPEVGESVSEVQIGAWHFGEGDRVEVDKAVVSVETDKVTVEVLSPATGRLSSILKAKGASAAVGEVIGVIEVLAEVPAPSQAQSVVDKAYAPPLDGSARRLTDPQSSAVSIAKLADVGEASAERASSANAETSDASVAAAWSSPSARRALAAQHRQTSSDAIRRTGEGVESVRGSSQAGHARPEAIGVVNPQLTGDDEEVVPMSPFRLTAAERLLHAQESAALLTTFNEIDMSLVQQVRKEYQTAFQEKHGIKLGLMSFFVRAAVEALKAVPVVNAEVRGGSIVYKKHYDIGVAIGGGRGLIVPVLRHAETMGFAAVERAISDYGARARDNKITLKELMGGTFTISNGGVYGSMLSTPIVNSPQSAILGLHAISERPVARDGQVVIRPMMYVALTYDHRIIDGREAVTFLRKVKEYVEQPTRLLLEL